MKKRRFQKEKKEAKKLAAERQKAALDLLPLRRENELKQEELGDFQEKHGSILEIDQEINNILLKHNSIQSELKTDEDAKNLSKLMD